jgi:hypothetical protein
MRGDGEDSRRPSSEPRSVDAHAVSDRHQVRDMYAVERLDGGLDLGREAAVGAFGRELVELLVA